MKKQSIFRNPFQKKGLWTGIFFFGLFLQSCFNPTSDGGLVHYRMTFTGLWNATDHPTGFPAGNHFSPVIGMVHNDSIKIFEPGASATPGIEDMAETGNTDKLASEIKNHITTGSASDLIEGSVVRPGTGSTSKDFFISPGKLVSLVSMIAPSPDWFVAGRDIQLYENGEWVKTKSVTLNSYDSGTEEGNAFILNNADTSPRGVIHRINTVGGNDVSVKPMAKVTFTRLN